MFESLDNLRHIRSNLAGVNDGSGYMYQASVANFSIAARMSKQLKDNHNDVSRCLTYVLFVRNILKLMAMEIVILTIVAWVGL